jgi:hypothetical protein
VLVLGGSNAPQETERRLLPKNASTGGNELAAGGGYGRTGFLTNNPAGGAAKRGKLHQEQFNLC